jgi:site-specific recombinase XerC
MTDLIVVQKDKTWNCLKAIVLDRVSSPITRRVYNRALDEFLSWRPVLEPRPPFSKAAVSGWRASLEARKLGSSSIIVRMSAIRTLAAEAADNGLLAPAMAAGVMRLKSAKRKACGQDWLSLAQSLLGAPDGATNKGLRNRGILATLLGCVLRRSEVAALTFTHLQQRDARWCKWIRWASTNERTVPMPTWVKVAIDAWTRSPK